MLACFAAVSPGMVTVPMLPEVVCFVRLPTAALTSSLSISTARSKPTPTLEGDTLSAPAIMRVLLPLLALTAMPPSSTLTAFLSSVVSLPSSSSMTALPFSSSSFVMVTVAAPILERILLLK